VRGELFLDRWQVPNLSTDPRDVSWYIESSYDVTAGLFVATRWNEIRFNRLPFNGLAEAWVYDVRRIRLRGLSLRAERRSAGGVRGQSYASCRSAR
jgi:hypothetical protein